MAKIHNQLLVSLFETRMPGKHCRNCQGQICKVVCSAVMQELRAPQVP